MSSYPTSHHAQLMRVGWRLPLLLVAIQAAAATLMHHHLGGSDQSSQLLPLACETSGMCSLGKVKPFLGDLVSAASMRACLEARSFRREVILLTENRLNPAYQTFHSLLRLGYEHVVLLSTSERCARSNTIWPTLGCGWSSQVLLNTNKLMMDRVAFMARGGRLGYNVLMLDSDVLPLRDLYSLLWAPPLGTANLVAMKDGNGWLNCGVVYIRNARPDGPAAYVLAEVVDRLERWAAHAQFYAVRGLNSYCWDQQMYSDTLLSALAGRPVSYGCWLRHEPSLRLEWDEAHLALFNATGEPPFDIRYYLKQHQLQWPEELLYDTPDYPNKGAAETWTGTMSVPNSRGVWPEELGGKLYAPERGSTSREWMDILRADVEPLWPDPEDPSQADAAASITETFAHLPVYLAESWSHGGALGYWNPALMPPAAHPPVALAHFVHVPGGATNKMTVKMATNHWDWDVAHAAHPHRGVFFASTSAAPVPDLLALSPELAAAEWADEGAFAGAVLALLRVAMEMGRAAAYPAPRCNVSWLGGAGNDKLPLVVNHGFYIPYSPAGKGFNDLRCLWAGYLPYGCLAARSYFPGGLLAPEYDHLLDLLHQDGHGNPSNSTSSTSTSNSAASRSAAHLTSLGFTVGPDHMAAAPGSGAGGGGGGEVVAVPPELLKPPAAAAAAWDVTQLAAALMDRYGGPGGGLDAAAADGSSSGAAAAAGSSSRPRVLVLSEVPLLTDRLGPRHEAFKQELESGPDRAFMSCDWVLTGRPYRRRRRKRRALMGEDPQGGGGDDEGGGGGGGDFRRW